MNHVIPIDQLLQQQVVDRTLHYIQLAESLFDCQLPPLPIHFDLRGRSSGMYRIRGRHREIRYNPWIFAAHFDECLTTTVPHEVAHLVVDQLYGLRNVRPHGVEWKNVMAAFGADARVTARLSLDGIPQRQANYYNYSCRCTSHRLGARRHHRILRGQVRYSCRRCGDVLKAAQ